MTSREAAPARRLPALRGFRYVLTADRTLMAAYPTLFDGMMAASQTTFAPAPIMRGLMAPRLGTEADGVRSPQAPLGLRRIEAALLRAGVAECEVAVVAPEQLGAAVGPDTALVAVSTGDPLGIGMNSTTMEALSGGRIYTAAWFDRVVAVLRACRRAGHRFRVVVGGAGTWQFGTDPATLAAMGIDHVVDGYCEAGVAAQFAALAAGEALPVHLQGVAPGAAAIPRVCGATVMGMVEASRGCGLGCGFCTLAGEPMLHLPADTVLADAETNVAHGVGDLALASEDILRYGGTIAAPAPDALLSLLAGLRRVVGRGMIQCDHVNVSSIAAFSDDGLRAVRERLAAPGQTFVWMNVGVETAAGDLLARNGGRPKLRPFGADGWADGCREQVQRLVACGFFPLVSLVVGLPGETPDDVERTRRWVCDLRGQRLAVFPLLYAPVRPGQPAPTLRPEHWRLFEASYGGNFRWLPRLVWEHQSLARAPLWRRLAIQVLGRCQIPLWQYRFARYARPAA